MSKLGYRQLGYPRALDGVFGGTGQVPTGSPAALFMSPLRRGIDLDLDPDWVVFIMVVSAGVGLGLLFAMVRLGRWISLRRPIPMRTDETGTSLPNRTLMRKISCFPGVIFGKLTLRSFYATGVPPLGMILLISSWVGFSLFATLFDIPLTLERIAYRLP
jgi:hypothetical protein